MAGHGLNGFCGDSGWFCGLARICLCELASCGRRSCAGWQFIEVFGGGFFNWRLVLYLPIDTGTPDARSFFIFKLRNPEHLALHMHRSPMSPDSIAAS
jgi:hypothetical protein